jgi:hypothetical protein
MLCIPPRLHAAVSSSPAVAAQLADVALGVDAVVQLAKAHVYLTADRLPLAVGRAELRRLRALVAIRARDAERGDARVAEGEDDVAPRELAHGLVEGISGFVSVALGDQRYPRRFRGVSFVLVDPPERMRYQSARPREIRSNSLLSNWTQRSGNRYAHSSYCCDFDCCQRMLNR